MFEYGFNIPTPLGELTVLGTKESIQFMKYLDDETESKLSTDIQQPAWKEPEWKKQCESQLNEYFAGKCMEFALPIDPQGTEFQKSVWSELIKVSNGELSSYQQLASACGNPKAVRAVASANARNPIWILIPCHRVIGSDMALRGYAGGLNRKAELLKLEKHALSNPEGKEYNEKTRVLNNLI